MNIISKSMSINSKEFHILNHPSKFHHQIIQSISFSPPTMCNTDRDPNKGKEKVNEEPVVNFKTVVRNNENKRKAIVLVEPDVETQNSKTSNNGDAGEEESTHSSKEMSPFLLFGFIIDPNRRMKRAYSCNFCNRKFITPQALGGHQNCHKWEKKFKKRIEDMNNANQGVVSQNTIIPYHGGYGYDNMIQGLVSQQITMTGVDYGLVSNGDAEHEDKEIEEEEESNIDLTLKL
jgi:hypothetical protein